jgi:hypothetical protein
MFGQQFMTAIAAERISIPVINTNAFADQDTSSIRRYARRVRREHIQVHQDCSRVFIATPGKFRQLEALYAALVRRERTLGVKTLAGLSVCLV